MYLKHWHHAGINIIGFRSLCVVNIHRETTTWNRKVPVKSEFVIITVCNLVIHILDSGSWMTRVPLQAAAARQPVSHCQQRQFFSSSPLHPSFFWAHPASAVCTDSYLPAVNRETQPNSGCKVTNVWTCTFTPQHTCVAGCLSLDHFYISGMFPG